MLELLPVGVLFNCTNQTFGIASKSAMGAALPAGGAAMLAGAMPASAVAAATARQIEKDLEVTMNPLLFC